MRKAVPYLLLVILSMCAYMLLPGLDSARAQQELPQLNRVRPDKLPAGSPTFTLRADGKKFQDGAQILFDDAPLSTSRVSDDRRVLAEIDSALVAVTGTHTVKVVNPDGGVSSTETLEIVEQDPDLMMRLGGNSVQEDLGQDFAFSITGDGFDENTEAVIWGTFATVTTFVSATEVIVQFPSDLAVDPARVPITIRNKGGHYSNVEIFFIVPAPASLRFVDPDSVEVGTDPFDIEVRGDGIKPGARLIVAGEPLETTARKNSRLVATVPGALRSGPGLLSVRVEQNGIQSADLTIVVAPSSDPFIFAVSPTRIRAGEKRIILDVNGANLGDQATVFVDGEEVKVTASTKRRLNVRITGSILESPGVHTLEVKGEDGVSSNVVSFEVVADVMVSTLVGDDKEGFSDGCVSAEEARFRRPRRMNLAADGLLYVTDQYNHSIRTINPNTGQVCTIAGTGLFGYNDSGNSAGKPPTFSFPNGVVVAPDGTIIVSENGNNVIRRIRRGGSTITVDTLAGQNQPILKQDRQDRLNSTLDGIDGFRDGSAANAAFRLPDDMVLAPDGSLYIADANNHAIRRLTVNGSDVRVETLAGNGVPGFADGIASAARFNTPVALALSLDGNSLFVADMNNFRIRRINLVTLRVDTFAGTGDATSFDGTATEASFARPIGLALDLDGVLYVAELDGNQIRRIDPQGNVTSLAGDQSKKFRDGEGHRATFNGPRGLAIDRARGMLYVADYENFRIRAIALR